MTIIQWSRANAKITRATILAVNIPALHNVWKIMPPQVITFLSALIILKAELYAAVTYQTNGQAKHNQKEGVFTLVLTNSPSQWH